MLRCAVCLLLDVSPLTGGGGGERVTNLKESKRVKKKVEEAQ
jgi:hypothetical protein